VGKRSVSRVTVAGHRLPSAEAEVLRVLLDADRSLLVTEVRDRLPGRQRAHTTVVTLLGRLVERGLARREGSTRGHQYPPAGTEEELAVAALNNVVGSLDDPAAAVVAFINQMPARARGGVRRALGRPDAPAP
jgi:predicted transcriptional regulator